MTNREFMNLLPGDRCTVNSGLDKGRCIVVVDVDDDYGSVAVRSIDGLHLNGANSLGKLRIVNFRRLTID